MHSRADAIMQRCNSYSLLSLAFAAFLAACSSAPPAARLASTASRTPSAHVSVGTEIAMRAMSLLGAPYRWGGASPSGFDCSGLVRFVHGQLGIATPRTAAEQFSAVRRVKLSGIEPGDLLFFRTDGKRISHVAIYTGEGRFIHAPKKGRPVELRTLDDEYYRPRLAGAGRLF
jgi:murein DD-endopeptidase